MEVQAELLRIGGLITDQETMVLSGEGSEHPRLRWANVERFLPGLAISATFRTPHSLERANIESISFAVLEADSNATLAVRNDSRLADTYEDPYSRYILAQFRAYEDRPDASMPVGISGLGDEEVFIEPSVLVIPEWPQISSS